MTSLYHNQFSFYHAEQELSPNREPERLRRNNSLVVTVWCPPSLKRALKLAADDRDCFKGSVNAFVRDTLKSRYHRPDLPSIDPSEPKTARLSLRLTYTEWAELREYANSWDLPLWKAIWLLATRPYTVYDRPRRRADTHMTYTTEEERRKEVKYVCTDVLAKAQPKELRPLNNLSFRLFNDYGVSLWVANSLVKNFPEEEVLAAIELRERRNGSIHNPAGFIVYLLKNGYAQRFAEYKRRRIDQNLRAEGVKGVLRERGVEIEDRGGVDYFIVDRNGCRWRPVDPTDLESALGLAERLGLLEDAKRNSQEAKEEKLVKVEGDSEELGEFDLGEGAEEVMGEELLAEGEVSEAEKFVCQKCGRVEGERHPALPSHVHNNLLPLSSQSPTIVKFLGAGEFGLICRGCLMEAWRKLMDERLKGEDEPT